MKPIKDSEGNVIGYHVDAGGTGDGTILPGGFYVGQRVRVKAEGLYYPQGSFGVVTGFDPRPMHGLTCHMDKEPTLGNVYWGDGDSLEPAP